MEEINDVYLAIGSNLGERLENLQQAVNLLGRMGTVRAISRIYENAAVGFEAEQQFLNACIHFQTSLSAQAVLMRLKEIEHQLGRAPKPANGYASRPIDLDIIFFNDEIHRGADLTIPHPKYTERNFVLKPLSELCPQKVCPLRQLTVLQLLKWSVDENPVFVYNCGRSIVIKC